MLLLNFVKIDKPKSTHNSPALTEINGTFFAKTGKTLSKIQMYVKCHHQQITNNISVADEPIGHLQAH